VSDKVTGIKTIQISATTRYPIVSAYEFEFLKLEEEIRHRLKGCTIYFILQRPLMYFNNVTDHGRGLRFDIVDTVHKPLHCELEFDKCGFVEPGDDCEVEFQFYTHEPDLAQPRNDVAGFKVLRNGQFVVWETPQKLLYEAPVNGLPLRVEGDMRDFLAYDVHYIGKAFSQRVWKRLTGHEKMQKILTLEPTIAAANRNSRAPFEITLLMLDIIGVTEANIFPYFNFIPLGGAEPIEHDLETEQQIIDFNTLKVKTDAPELTSEVEALLIHQFKPAYNEKKFASYPNIDKGDTVAWIYGGEPRHRKMPGDTRNEVP
jgi:hypothetical protein